MAKHHYNANFNLRRFVGNDGTLWVLDKDTGRCWPKKGGSNNRYDAFAENGYNTIKDTTGNDDNSVEDFYTKIEGLAGPVIGTIIMTVEAGLLPPISPLDKEHLVRFLWAQHVRSPFVRMATRQDGTADMAMEKAILETCQKLGIPPSSIHGYLQKSLDQIIDDAIIKAPTALPERDSAVVYMRDMALDLLKIPEAVNLQFITSRSFPK